MTVRDFHRRVYATRGCMQQVTCENSALTTPVDSKAFQLSRSDEVGGDEDDYEETHQYSKRRDSQDAGLPSTGFR